MRERLKEWFWHLQVLWRWWRRDAVMWRAAEIAVKDVIEHHHLQRAAQVESQISYCPRCGQRPDGDRRLEEARERALNILAYRGAPPRRSDLDFALTFHYWIRRA